MAAYPGDTHNSDYGKACVGRAHVDLSADGRPKECLWLRGLIPLGALPHIDRDTPDGNLEGNLDALCDGAVIFSDGTLGPYSQTANLKHGGWGWCIIDHSGTVLLAEYGLLEGDVQDRPKGRA